MRGCQNPWTGGVGGAAVLAMAAVLAVNPPAFLAGGHRFYLLLIPMCAAMLWIEFSSRPLRLCRWAELPGYHRSWKKILVSAAWRYGVLAAVATVFYAIYERFPYYVSDYFDPFRSFVRILYLGFLLIGYPYIVATLRWRGSVKEELSDTALILMAAGRAAWRTRGARPGGEGPRRRVWAAVGGILVEAFFLPLMTVFLSMQYAQLSIHLGRLAGGAPGGFAYWETVYRILFHSLYLMDVALAIAGYALPSRWLDNKIRSVEPTFVGWLSAISCYPPFNEMIFRYMVFEQNPEYQIIHSEPVLLALMALDLFFMGLYVWATMAFGFRFSNLTHRGVIARGPYAYLRHPAYAGKNLSWWVETIPYLGNPVYLVSLIGWNIIYVLRATTEEDHLERDPEYRAYAEQVRYRFIPGLY
ncbi:MAG: hypothetical protein A3G34_04720 [Candidatus Lindowbacteria bacterium RIFCSPLOWO2_12_FULL_62_27]|nr:MAG: hypothetical protein A3I06_13040 [Candidatus Lindowbacteria bacterium RIFCSPLOWO2_02_FULL_62_12]OGH61304.1 MAG: hypothetical protein A3G34_04720 [Candidatus Lindowbacteria bacterium RIFCSPLOWO2_12_FULL_62_27]